MDRRMTGHKRGLRSAGGIAVLRGALGTGVVCTSFFPFLARGGARDTGYGDCMHELLPFSGARAAERWRETGGGAARSAGQAEQDAASLDQGHAASAVTRGWGVDAGKDHASCAA